MQFVTLKCISLSELERMSVISEFYDRNSVLYLAYELNYKLKLHEEFSCLDYVKDFRVDVWR